MVMNYIAVTVAIVFFILIFPLPLRLQAYASTEQKRMYYTIKLFAISLYSGYLQSSGGKLTETNFLGKRRLLDFKDVKIDPRGLPELIGVSIFKRATFTKLNLFFEIGRKDDLFFVNLGYGFLSALVGGVFSRIRMRNPVIRLGSYVITKTDKNIGELTVGSNFSVSLISIVISIITDLIKVGLKNVRNNERSYSKTKRDRESA